MDSDGVDIVLAIADAEGTAIEIETGVTANLTAHVAEVHVMLLQVSLHESIRAHVHVEVETRHGFFQALDIHPALLVLAVELGGGVLEALDELHHTHRGVDVGIVVLVLDHDAGEPRGTVQRGIGFIGH